MSQFVNANGNTLLNLNFSLEEQETGLYWIDGKKIYVTRVKNEDEARIIYKIAHENRKYYKDNKSFRKLVKEYYNNTLQGGLIYANSTL